MVGHDGMPDLYPKPERGPIMGEFLHDDRVLREELRHRYADEWQILFVDLLLKPRALFFCAEI